MSSMEKARNAKEHVRNLLHGIVGINGIGIGWTDNGEPCVRVNVVEDIDPRERRKIPREACEVPVQVESIGIIRHEGR